jgi:hypothetical protein
MSSAAKASPGVVPGGARKEKSDNYREVVAVLNPKLRVVRGSCGLQWLVQKKVSPREWKSSAFCATREGLLLRLQECGYPCDVAAWAIIEALPDYFPKQGPVSAEIRPEAEQAATAFPTIFKGVHNVRRGTRAPDLRRDAKASCKLLRRTNIASIPIDDLALIRRGASGPEGAALICSKFSHICLREGFRMPADAEPLSMHRRPASESRRRRNARGAGHARNCTTL